MNNGDRAILSLVTEKVKQAKMQMDDMLSYGIVGTGGDGTGTTDAKEIDGLQIANSITNTYGGIAVADMATWKATVNSNGGTVRNLTLPLLQQVFGLSTYSSTPDFGVCDQNVNKCAA